MLGPSCIARATAAALETPRIAARPRAEPLVRPWQIRHATTRLRAARARSVAAAQNLEFDAPVLGATFVGVVVGDRFVRTKSVRLQARRVDAVLDEILHHRAGA